MGRSGDDRTYYPCLKCDVWVPHYAKETHTVECHQLGLSKFSHPYCKEYHLYAHISIIENNDEESNSSKRKSNSSKRKESRKSGNESASFGSDSRRSNKSSKASVSSEESFKSQPEWLKKIFPSFHYRLVLMNESDLIRNDIVAYSPVALKCKNYEVAFLAIPEESIQVGHIALHATGVDLYLPSIENESLVDLYKISDIHHASKVYLKPDQSLKSSILSKVQSHIHSLLLRGSGSLGVPFALKKGSKLFLKPDKATPSFTVSGITIVDESTYFKRDNDKVQNFTNDSVFDSEQVSSSEYLTLDEWGEDSCSGINNSEEPNDLPEVIEGISKLNLSSNESGGYITIDEYQEGDSKNELSINNESEQSKKDETISGIECNIITSTPRKKTSKGSKDENSLYKPILADKCREKLISSIHMGDNTDSSKILYINNWFYIKNATEIIIEENCESKIEEQLKKISGKNIEKYCEDESYLQLVKIIQKKIKEFDSSVDPLYHGWSGVLLSGPPGTGKTLMATSVADNLGLPLFKFTLEDDTILHGKQDKDEAIRKLFKRSIERAPSMVFLDDIDCQCPNDEQSSKKNPGITDAVIKCFHIIQSASVPVVILAASSFSESISRKLCRSGYFDKEIILSLPDITHRKQILSHILHSHKHNLTDSEIYEVAAKAYGFTGADLNVMVRCSWVNCVKRWKNDKTEMDNLVLNQNDLNIGIKGVVPTVLRHNYTAVSKVKWSDIYGYLNIKTKLQRMIEMHLSHPSQHLLKGLLFYGPPGCSKTMFVRAMVHETGFSFFPLKCSDLLSKYVGETEKNLSKIFNRARQAAPSIIFMDEIDSLCSQRGDTGGSGLISELLSLTALLTSTGNVMLVGATNRPHAIDEALLRPGCLEQILHIDLPDTAARELMWHDLLDGVPRTGNFDNQYLASVTEGYSGAEIVGVYQVAAHKALSALDVGRISEDSADGLINMDDHNLSVNQEMILNAIKCNPSRTPSALLDAIAQFTRQRTALMLS